MSLVTVYEFVCPTCTMKAWSSDHYVTCACCGTFYYASQSAHRPWPQVTAKVRLILNGVPIYGQ